jgi:uncharacterized membrane protein
VGKITNAKEGVLMNKSNDPYSLGKNVQIIVVIILVFILLTDVLMRLSPGMFYLPSTPHATSAVGYHHQFSDSSWYYIYTVFEDNGDVYQVWWDGREWNQKKVTNYRADESK